MKLNLYLVKSSIVGALGGLLFGFDTAVIAGTTHGLSVTFRLSSAQLGLTVSIALWGTVLGAMISGILGEKLGGRSALRIMAALYLLSALGCAFAWNWPALLIFRFIGGIGIGGSSVLGPVYIAEIAPAKWRGRLVGMFQINVVVGISVGVWFKPLPRNAESRPGSMALPAWHCSHPGNNLPHLTVCYPDQLTMACYPEQNRRSSSGSRTHRFA